MAGVAILIVVMCLLVRRSFGEFAAAEAVKTTLHTAAARESSAAAGMVHSVSLPNMEKALVAAQPTSSACPYVQLGKEVLFDTPAR